MKHLPELLILLGFLANAELGAATPTFTVQPVIKQDGHQFRIAFAVSAPTDVEVAILDATNGVIRHLAAGVLQVFRDTLLVLAIIWIGNIL